MAEPLNATFFAFRKRERRGVLLQASIAYAVLGFAVSGLFLWLNWQAVLDYIAWSMTLGEREAAIDPNDPNAVFAALMPPASVMSLMPAYMLLYFVIYLLFAAYEAACLRWMIRGEVKGLFGLSLDADTWRVYFTYWLWFFFFMAIYIVLVVVALAAAIGVGLAVAGGGGDAAGIGALVAVAACFAVFLGLTYVGVRFAPAAATSIAKRRFAFFDAWQVTKGRFWALFGSFALLLLMMFVGVIIVMVALGVVMAMGAAGLIDGAAKPGDMGALLALFTSPSVWIPGALVYALMIVGSFAFYLALFGVNARAAQAALEEGKIQPAQ